jgi:hypothetical protein
MIEKIRKNIGSIVSLLGFLAFSILIYGGLSDIDGAHYWVNVYNNLTQIGLNSIAATLLQVLIKQGLAEQALQKGINTEDTILKYEEHRDIRQRLFAKEKYLPYFLIEKNERETKHAKQEFIVNKGFKNEKHFYETASPRVIKKYDKIMIKWRASSIKWTSAKIEYDKFGRIITLPEHRQHRALKGVIYSAFFMILLTFLARDLFVSFDWSKFWVKTILLFGYAIVMAATVTFDLISEYEYGKFAVAVSLEEINKIWLEFERWEVPEQVLDEVHGKQIKGGEENAREEAKAVTDGGADIQEQPEESEVVENAVPDNLDTVVGLNNLVRNIYAS